MSRSLRGIFHGVPRLTPARCVFPLMTQSQCLSERERACTRQCTLHYYKIAPADCERTVFSLLRLTDVGGQIESISRVYFQDTAATGRVGGKNWEDKHGGVRRCHYYHDVGLVEEDRRGGDKRKVMSNRRGDGGMCADPSVAALTAPSMQTVRRRRPNPLHHDGKL